MFVHCYKTPFSFDLLFVKGQKQKVTQGRSPHIIIPVDGGELLNVSSNFRQSNLNVPSIGISLFFECVHILVCSSIFLRKILQFICMEVNALICLLNRVKVFVLYGCQSWLKYLRICYGAHHKIQM